MQQGIKQHPSQHPMTSNVPDNIQVKRPGLVNVSVIIEEWQFGHCICTGYGPNCVTFTITVGWIFGMAAFGTTVEGGLPYPGRTSGGALGKYGGGGSLKPGLLDMLFISILNG